MENKSAEGCKVLLDNMLEWAKEYEECDLKVNQKEQTITWNPIRWETPRLEQEQAEILDSILWCNNEYEEIGYKFDRKNLTVRYGENQIRIYILKNVISFILD